MRKENNPVDCFYPKFDSTQKWVKTPSTTIDDLFKNM